MNKTNDNVVNNLRLIQLLQLRLLIDFKKITDKLNIDYFLIAGSLLGSVRHGGFIPWDTDIDVAMSRSDYNTLIENFQILDKHISLQCDETDKKNKTGFARFRLIDTVYIEKGNKVYDNKQGLYIDIFPLDKYLYRNKFIDFINFYIYKYLIRLKAFKNGKRFSSTKIRSLISFIICFPSLFLHVDILKKYQNKISQQYSNTDSNYLNNFNSKYGLQRQYMSKDVYYPPSVTFFEGHEFKSPNMTDKWLKQIYGNYLKLPKNQIRHTNELINNYIIDFGNYSYLLGKPEEFVINELGLSHND